MQSGLYGYELECACWLTCCDQNEMVAYENEHYGTTSMQSDEIVRALVNASNVDTQIVFG